MPRAIGKMVRTLAADGYFGKQDLSTATTAMLDGKGITKTEKKQWAKNVADVLADPAVRTTEETRDAFTALKGRMKGFSQKKGVFAPTLDKDEIKNILARFKSSGTSSYGVSASSSGEGSTASFGGGYSVSSAGGGE